MAAHKVQLSYQLSAKRSPDALIRNPLLDFLAVGLLVSLGMRDSGRDGYLKDTP